MSWWLLYNLAEWTVRLVMVPVILRRRFMPVTSLAWLSVIFVLPAAGLGGYLLLGGDRLGKKRVRRHRAALSSIQMDNPLEDQPGWVVRPQVDPALRGVIRQAERISGMPILDGNQVELLTDTDQTVRRLIADIDAAEHHVHLMYYIFAPDQTGRLMAEALIRAAERGVHCRLLADAAGSRQLFKRGGLADRLNRRGVRTVAMLPASLLRRRLARLDLRNHRKLAVIDGYTAYAGSQNIVDADYGHRRAGMWVDLTGRFTGPVVEQLQTVFLEDWLFETNHRLDEPTLYPTLEPMGSVPAQSVPTGPTQESETLLRVILTAISAAQRRIIITSPYLVPDEPTLLALSMAADRGVDVKIVVPASSDHPLVAAAGRAYFHTLLEAGVKIYRYNTGMLHAKTMTVDDAFALLGSSNLDIRSFYLNFELNVLLYGPQVTQNLRLVQLRYLHQATPIDRDRWRRRPQIRQYLDSAAALLSPLL